MRRPWGAGANPLPCSFHKISTLERYWSGPLSWSLIGVPVRPLAFSTPAHPYSRLSEQRLRGATGILAPAIRVVQQSCQEPRLLDQLRIAMGCHRPTNHQAREPTKHDRDRQPAHSTFNRCLCYSIPVRLSAYAKKMGVSYKTAFRWWKSGKLDASR